MKPIIALDIDGILADFIGSAIETCQRWYGVALPPPDHAGWPWTQLPDHRHESFRWVMQSDIFNHLIKPVPWGFAIHEAAQTYGRKVVYITARNPRTRLVTEAWLQRTFGVREPTVLYRQQVGVTKGDLALAVGATLMVEDNLAEAKVVGEKLGIGSLLLDMPYNHEYETPDVAPRPYQRLTVEEIVEVMKNSRDGKAWRRLIH